MTRKKIMSVIAAAAVMASVSGTVFANSGATPSNAYSMITGTPTDTYLTVTDSNNPTTDSTRKTTQGAMVLKKVLEVPDTSYIPYCKFDLTATVPDVLKENVNGTDVDNANGLCVYPTSTTLGVYSGLHPELIKWSEVLTSGNAFSATHVDNAATASATTTLTYVSQNPDPSAITTSSENTVTGVSDNVLINSTTANDKVYYAIKELQLDFSGCQFTEPGVYRYYIEEKGQTTNVGITDDYKNLDTDGSEKANVTRFRTIDVYVYDASYDDATNNKVRKLGIAGYVMYIGKVTGAPQNYKTNAGTLTDDGILETGVKNKDINSGANSFYGTKNGVEVTDAVKSEGFINKLDTNKLTFKKIVKGNQGSMNKYFKFVVKLTGDATNSNIQDTDTYIISTESAESSYDEAPEDNTATYWTSAVMKTEADKNDATKIIGGNTVTKINTNQRVVTGAQLKAGYAFYLHDGQFITITGIPKGLGYTITEYNEDYVPAIINGVTGSTTYDTINGDGTGASAITLDKSNADKADVYSNTAVITDTNLTSDAYETFENERKGAIPTGVVLATAAPVGVGIAAVAGIIALAVKNRKKKED